MFYPLFKLRLAPRITSRLKAAGYCIISAPLILRAVRLLLEMLRLGYVSCPDCASEQMSSVRIRSYTSYVSEIFI